MKFIYQTISEQMESTDWEVIKSALYRAIENLPEDQRTIINYHFYDDITLKEISKILNRPISYVYSHLRKAEYNLRMQLNPAYYKRILEIMYGPDFNFSEWAKKSI